MEQLVDVQDLESRYQSLLVYYQQLQTWLFQDVLALSTLTQAVLVVLAFLPAFFLQRQVRAGLELLKRIMGPDSGVPAVARAVAPLAMPIAWLILQWFSIIVAAQMGWPYQLIQITVSLLTAWVVIRAMSAVVRDPTWSSAIAGTAWVVAALNILGLLDDATDILDGLALQLGDLRLSALTVIKGMIALAVLLWLATVMSRLLERRISRLPNLTPSVQVLISKLFKIVLIVIAIVAALRTVGIDLTAFAVFSGAVGVGVGFGLQKVVSNLISGVILLMDKSVKPGDVIEVGQTYGWIKTLGARYASVVTRDGTEYLIPNEDIITQRVVNWSYSNDAVRLKIPIGISYGSDVRKAIEICQAAPGEVPRALKEPKSVCLLKGFGDSSVDLELRFWINDPRNGVSNVKSQVLLLIWDAFHEHGIEIPFPQRDLHIKSAPEVPALSRAAS
ncbi:MAG: mechanosensitive ion channel [Rhodospirillales bacterium]|nr:mechanosensitive ion channel [Rhodospirillales bacterium]